MQGPKTKDEFYAGWMSLRFGNRIRMWGNLEELLADDYQGTVTVRTKVAGGECHYGVPGNMVESLLTGMIRGGLKAEDFSFNESAPDNDLLIQGELCHDTQLGGYCLFSSTDKLPMRKALAASGTQYRGLQALGRLKHYCNTRGYEMLMELLDLYPEAVIEFGAYGHKLGVLPHNNVITWEVREY